MEICRGKSVYEGVAIGKILIYQKGGGTVELTEVSDTGAEVERYMAAKEKAGEQIERLREKALRDVGEAEAEIFEAHKMLLEDLDFVEGVTDMINSARANAEYAVRTVSEQFAEMFSQMDDEYFRGRAADVRDVAGRLVSILSGHETSVGGLTEPVIIFAEDLAPSETVQFEKDKILAIVTQKGSASSHTAILARVMNIPCVVTADIVLDPSISGLPGIVDGFDGKIYIEPDEETSAAMAEKKKKHEEAAALLEEMKGLPTVTKSGRKINLYSNIGGVGDVDAVLANDSEGIGLFRSEFLYLGRDDFPGEEEQFEAYRAVVSALEGKKVIIRTLDIGADKKADYFGLEKEDNPALGMRAIRICLTRPEVFRTQLRAIYRASAFGTVSIMFPMIISVDEVRRCKEAVEQVKRELSEEGIEYGDVELGIMVETPASVILADQLAEEVDFFSIGTNDLTQYTLAIDRQNQSLDSFCDTHSEAVLRMIHITCKCAHEHGAWCGICGELAADTELTDRFIAMGIDELSVSPTYTLKLRKKIRETE